jgi:hypothetical protein
VTALDRRSALPLWAQLAEDLRAKAAAGEFSGRPIRVRYMWSNVATPTPRWEQAFSDDGGTTWETNWVVDFTRAD